MLELKTNFWWQENGCRSSCRYIQIYRTVINFAFITAAELTFVTCGNDHQWVFAEGLLLGFDNGPTCCRNINVTIPTNTVVVGVQVQNTVDDGGWRGIFSDGSGANAPSWKCTESPQADTRWTTAGYNDSNWKVPVVLPINSQSCIVVPPGSPLPDWLWTRTDIGVKIKIYCRTVMRM